MANPVAINGAGRLGRELIKQCIAANVSIACINDVNMSPDMLVYLLKYDTVYYGKNNAISDVTAGDDYIVIEGKQIPVKAVADWSTDTSGLLVGATVIECSGVYKTKEQLQTAFINAGALRVIAPYLASNTTTAIASVNENDAQDEIIFSTGTADTAALSLIAKIVNDAFGVEYANSITLSAYNNMLSLTDFPTYKSPAYGRAAAQNMIPVATFGAAKAVASVLPELSNKFDGQVCYTSVLAGTLSYIHFKFTKAQTIDDVKATLKVAAEGEHKSFMAYTDDKILPSDVLTSVVHAVVSTAYIKAADTEGYEWTIACMYDHTTGFAAQTLYMAQKYGGVAVQSVAETYESIKAVNVDNANQYVANLQAYVARTNNAMAVTTSLESAENAAVIPVDMNFYAEVCEFLETLETA